MCIGLFRLAELRHTYGNLRDGRWTLGQESICRNPRCGGAFLLVLLRNNVYSMMVLRYVNIDDAVASVILRRLGSMTQKARQQTVRNLLSRRQQVSQKKRRHQSVPLQNWASKSLAQQWWQHWLGSRCEQRSRSKSLASKWWRQWWMTSMMKHRLAQKLMYDGKGSFCVGKCRKSWFCVGKLTKNGPMSGHCKFLLEILM